MRVAHLKCIAAVVLGFALLVGSFAQQPSDSGTVAVSMVVSVEAKHGKEIPIIYPDDVRVFHDHERLKVQSWTPYRADKTDLELFLLIDDSVDSSIGLQFNDLKKFIAGQAPSTLIALGYIRNGSVQVAQNFTTDHDLVAKALRLPIGAGVMASPYTAVTEMIQHWPPNDNRHEILMVTSGIDALQPGVQDTYLDEAIATAQRAGVQVYSVYASNAGHFGHTLWRVSVAQSNLSRLTDETGGEAYFQGLEMPISFAPYLNQFADRLQHQFNLTFLAKPAKKAELQSVRLETEVPNAELVGAGRVWVPAAR